MAFRSAAALGAGPCSSHSFYGGVGGSPSALAPDPLEPQETVRCHLQSPSCAPHSSTTSSLPQAPHLLPLSEAWNPCGDSFGNLPFNAGAAYPYPPPHTHTRSPSASAWQLPPGRDGGALAGSSLWASHHSPLCLYDTDTDRQMHICLSPGQIHAHHLTGGAWTPSGSQNHHPIP